MLIQNIMVVVVVTTEFIAQYTMARKHSKDSHNTKERTCKCQTTNDKIYCPKGIMNSLIVQPASSNGVCDVITVHFGWFCTGATYTYQGRSQ